MQLTPSFLLLGILFPIILNANAIPFTREQTGVVKLPLKRAPMRRDLHPMMVRPLISCLSNTYCDTIEQLFQMHNARAQRRLARMTGRAVTFDNEVDRLSVREAHVAARGVPRIGHPGAHLGSNNDLNALSTCAFCPCSHFIVLTHHTPIRNNSADNLASKTADEGFSAADANALADNTLTPADSPTASNSLGLNIEADDVGYIATVQMGTPPREFKVLMDSGSADLWVGAEGCQVINGTGTGCVSSSLDSFSLLPDSSSLV